MGRADYYKHGDYNVICDYSGFKAKASQCRKTWDGYLVLERFWEPRHEQDFVRAVGGDDQSVPIPRPEKEWEYIEDLYPNGVDPEDL